MIRESRLPLFYLCALAAVALLVVLSLCAGAVRVSPGAIWSAVRGDTGGVAYKIVRFVRLPRAVAAVLCGAIRSAVRRYSA